jgi:hypothetical protein
MEHGRLPPYGHPEDASINLAAVAEMRRRFPALDLILIESGGDNLAATFSPETVCGGQVSGSRQVCLRAGQPIPPLLHPAGRGRNDLPETIKTGA